MNWGMLQVTLHVRHVVRSVAFYRTVLGFDFQGYWDPASQTAVEEWKHGDQPDYAEVRAGENRIGLQPMREPVEPGAIDCALYVDDVDALYASVREKGWEATAPVDNVWGSRTFALQDPDGHPWTCLQAATQ